MSTYYAYSEQAGTGHAGSQADPFSVADFWTWFTTTCSSGDVCEVKDGGSHFALGSNRVTSRDGSAAAGHIRVIGVSDWGTPAVWGSLPKFDGASYEIDADNYWCWANIEFNVKQLDLDEYPVIVNCLFEANVSSTLLDLNNYAALDGCVIRNANTSTSAIIVDIYAMGRVSNCYISSNGPRGVYSYANGTIVSNTVFDGCYYGYYGSYGTMNSLFNCTFHDCNYGLYSTSSSFAGFKILGCVFAWCANYGVYQSSSSGDIFCDYNLFYNCGGNYYNTSYIIGRDNDISGDPLFVDRDNATWSSRDFSVGVGSPALDAALPFRVGAG